MINLVDLAPDFLFIIEKGFVSSSATYNPKEFGNATLVMRGPPFSLQFERDRGQIFVNIGNIQTEWYKFEHVVEFLNNSISDDQLGEPPNISFLARILHEQWENISLLFKDQKKMMHLQEFVQKKIIKLY